jgi:hypothetical protein
LDTLSAAEDPFDLWDATDVYYVSSYPQNAFSFFEENSEDFHYEAEDIDSVWATFGAVDGVAGNVETAEFVFVGAAFLTAANSVIVATLFF